MCSLGSLASASNRSSASTWAGREARRVGEALGGVDVLALVDRREEALVPVERRDLEIGLLAFRHLAAPVGGDRLEQELQQVGPAAAHLVEDRGRAHQRRQAAGLRRLEAQQADDVAGVGVKGLALVASGRCGHWDRPTSSPRSCTWPSTWPLPFCERALPRWAPSPKNAVAASRIDQRSTGRPRSSRKPRPFSTSSRTRAVSLRPERRQREVAGRDRGDVGLARGQRLGRRLDLGDLGGASGISQSSRRDISGPYQAAAPVCSGGSSNDISGSPSTFPRESAGRRDRRRWSTA